MLTGPVVQGPPPADLVGALAEAVAAGEAGREADLLAGLEAVAPGLFAVPPAWPVDEALLSAVSTLAGGTSSRRAANELHSVLMMLAWHLGADARLVTATRAMISSARDLAIEMESRPDPGPLVALAQSVVLFTALLDVLEVAPAEGVEVLMRAAQRIRGVPGGEAAAAQLLADATRWCTATGLVVDALPELLTDAARVLSALVGQAPPGPAVRDLTAVCLGAFELAGLAEEAQRARFDLVHRLLNDELYLEAEPLFGALREPVVMVDQDLTITLFRIRLSVARRELAPARTMIAQLEAGLPAEHPARQVVAALRTGLAEMAGDWATAASTGRPYVERALAAAPAEDRDGSYAMMLVRAARTASRVGDAALVERLRGELTRLGGLSPAAGFALPIVEGWLQAGAGDTDAARARLRLGVDAVSTALGAAPERVAAQGPMVLRASVLDELADLAAAVGDADAARSCGEEQRAELLRAGTAARRVLGSAPGVVAFAEACLRPRRRASPGPAAAAGTLLAGQLAARLRQGPLRTLGRAPVQPPVDVADAAARLHTLAGPQWALASVGLGADGLWVVGSDGERTTVRRRALDTRPVLDRVVGLFTTLTGSGPRPDDTRWVGDAERCLADLDEILGRLLREVLEETGRDRLVISAPGPLAGVPLAALGRGDRGRLVDTVEALCVVPGLGWAAGVADRPARQATAVTAAALVDPTIPLAALEGELVAAAHRRSGDVHRLIPLRQADLAAAAASSRIVHLAAHASWNRLEVIRSGLELGSGERLDSGELLAALDLNGTDLAVLSACDTASGTLFATGEALNLASMMLMAGARQVVASLWPVGDEPTLLTMVELHRQVAAGVPAAEALLSAQRTVRAMTGAAALATIDGWLADAPEQTAELTGLRGRWAARPPDSLPYARLDAWAPFVCLGPPQPPPKEDRP